VIYFSKCLLFKSALRSAKLALRNEIGYLQPRSAAVAGLRTSQYPALLGAYKCSRCYAFVSKILAHSRLRKPMQLPLRRQCGFWSCILGFEGSLLANIAIVKVERTARYIDMLNSCRYQIQMSLITRDCWSLVAAAFHRRIQATNKTNKLRGLSPRANYTDRATAACRPRWYQHFRIDGCRVISAADPLWP
jgi:hypothetical protein